MRDEEEGRGSVARQGEVHGTVIQVVVIEGVQGDCRQFIWVCVSPFHLQEKRRGGSLLTYLGRSRERGRGRGR